MKQAVPVTDRLNSAWMGQAKRNSVLRPRCSVNGNVGLESACDFASVIGNRSTTPRSTKFSWPGHAKRNSVLRPRCSVNGNAGLESACDFASISGNRSARAKRKCVLRPRCHGFACPSACDRVRRVAIDSILLGQASPSGTPLSASVVL